MVKFSIIVPVYNVEPYLKKCIDSILNQTFKDFELILVDDGSTDASLHICEHFLEIDPRVLLYKEKNSGVSVARNLGLQKCSGEFVLFVDGDDWLEPNALNLLNTLLLNNNLDILEFSYRNVTSINTINENENAMLSLDIISREETLIKSFTISNSCWNKAYKRTIINFSFATDISIGEDVLFATKAFLASNHIGFTSACLYNRLVHEGSAMHKDFDVNFLDGIDASERCYNILLKENKKFESLGFYIISGYIQNILSKFAASSKNNLNKCSRAIDFMKIKVRLYCGKILFNKYIPFRQKIHMILFLILGKKYIALRKFIIKIKRN